MRDLLVMGRQSVNGTYYVHVGDLDWWLYYLQADSPPWQNIYLWEDKENPGSLAAWSLLSPAWNSFDVFISPAWHATSQVDEVYTWTEERLVQMVDQDNNGGIRTMWVAEHDDRLIARLSRHGFVASNQFMENMVRDLSSLQAITLPAGFNFRMVMGEMDLENRAAAQYAVFGSRLPFDKYCQRYLRFMRSPAYSHAMDLVIEAPGGQIVAFCILWPDVVTRVGLFEPVGVHPNFQKRGLGKALLADGLLRLRSAGMDSAIVDVECDNQPALHLYRSVGFITAERLITFTKPLMGDTP